ncbi:MAG: PCRF domain-containing protein, partial [Verrucomicrobiia bacterium]
MKELEEKMAVDSFWDKREAAQKVVEECAGLRKRIEPLRTAEKQLGDLQLMAELGAEEDEATQTALVAEVTADTEKFIASLDVLELAALLSDPQDRNNCILTINAGAGGTESCDWAD